MTTTHTFNVHFWLKKSSIKSDGRIPIYASIWIDSIPVDLSTKEAIFEEHWNSEAKRVKSRIKAVKLRYLGKDKAVLTFKNLLDYHKDNELGKLAPGTTKNYSSTEKYLDRFIKKQFNSTDIHLTQINYSFVVKFENYLRTCPPLKKSQPLKNNGIMKHLERMQKHTILAFKHGWIKINPFALYELKFEEFDYPFLEQCEIDTMYNLSITQTGMCLIRDISKIKDTCKVTVIR
ncbi:phage integrase SAM-like domain and Arm DNA-binding domain-containing protein [Flavivirga algicola]|uniref:Phage integrase SAM-like domain-containing protein n=1 Tax=Flavivirga algicola TaxID=2729136 RepID=A0ABX1S3S0_9FLAO|nr:phage integrase SAM-like domain and Arm DNA-binding domain-containing protein [Flavivirga algicola]NMH89885.1 hypothetical protein [Flavivirga algicola]